MIVIIDYGCGNLLSLKRALDEFKFKSEVSKDKSKILNADLLILPGVGAFENAIKLLKKNDLIDTIVNFTIKKNKPLIGICLGMQILFTKSFEMGEHNGLNLIEGDVDRINKNTKNRQLKVPHISWNEIFFKKKASFNKDSTSSLNEKSFYFVHSYMATPSNEENLIANCKYFDVEVPAIVKKGKIVGFQFHPEKSGKNGLKLLKQTINDLLK